MQGGLEQYLMALAAGLRDEARGEWAYTVLASSEDRDWMRPFVGPDHDIVARPVEAASPAEGLKKWLGPARGPAGRIWRHTLKLAGQQAPEREQPPVVVSDGFIERLGVDVVHFPYIAHYEQTSVPAVLTVHDLQHRHFPAFFSKRHLAWREAAYPAAMAHATMVVADSNFVRDDIVRQYGVPADKVVTIPLASSLGVHQRPSRELCERLRQRWQLPDAFALYPAMTNEHKNHARLLDAVATLRDQGRIVQVVCSGKQAHVWPAIQRRLRELRLEDQVRFTGFIALRRTARAVRAHAVHRVSQPVRRRRTAGARSDGAGCADRLFRHPASAGVRRRDRLCSSIRRALTPSHRRSNGCRAMPR